jgi:hypothetical protein
MLIEKISHPLLGIECDFSQSVINFFKGILKSSAKENLTNVGLMEFKGIIEDQLDYFIENMDLYSDQESEILFKILEGDTELIIKANSQEIEQIEQKFMALGYTTHWFDLVSQNATNNERKSKEIDLHSVKISDHEWCLALAVSHSQPESKNVVLIDPSRITTRINLEKSTSILFEKDRIKKLVSSLFNANETSPKKLDCIFSILTHLSASKLLNEVLSEAEISELVQKLLNFSYKKSSQDSNLSHVEVEIKGKTIANKTILSSLNLKTDEIVELQSLKALQLTPLFQYHPLCNSLFYPFEPIVTHSSSIAPINTLSKIPSEISIQKIVSPHSSHPPLPHSRHSRCR